MIIASETGSWAAEVRQTLLNTGILQGAIDIFDARAANPSESLLSMYDAVLVYSNTDFRNENQLGTRLAKFVDDGGGVVQAGLSLNSNDQGLGGRWAARDYGVWDPGSTRSGTRLTLGNVADPNHPIFDGVDSLDGGTGSWHNNVGRLTAGSQLLASWSNGVDLVAVNTTRPGTVVGLNFFPPSDQSRADFWVSSSDGGILIANALGFAGAPMSVPEPSSVILFSAITAGVAAVGWRRRRRSAANAHRHIVPQ